MLKKYYVGSVQIGEAVGRGENQSNMCETVEEAIAKATNAVRKGTVDCAVVVEIIRIVRKDYPPVTVEIV